MTVAKRHAARDRSLLEQAAQEIAKLAKLRAEKNLRRKRKRLEAKEAAAATVAAPSAAEFEADLEREEDPTSLGARGHQGGFEYDGAIDEGVAAISTHANTHSGSNGQINTNLCTGLCLQLLCAYSLACVLRFCRQLQ